MNVTHLKQGIPWQKQDFGIPRMPNSVCVTRYGGFGDMMQVASVFAALKERDQDLHITLNTTPRGYSIAKHDPHIDAFFLQDDNQVPREELDGFWEKLAPNFDKHIQLSECVEGSLLASPERKSYRWSKEHRHEVMNVNYLENTHRMAGVPDAPFKPFFYPSEIEKRKAKALRKTYGKENFVILWSLAGSSVHKTWPYADNVMAFLLDKYPEVRIILVGDEICWMLERGWEKEPKVLCKSGKWSIRKTLSMVPHMDLVIGTETGVLNAAGALPVPKIVMLSHSTEENLTKHWLNTVSLAPEDTPCYPCHQMHYGFVHCSRDEVIGTSTCAANIGYDRVIVEVEKVIEDWRNVKHEHLPNTLPDLR